MSMLEELHKYTVLFLLRITILSPYLPICNSTLKFLTQDKIREEFDYNFEYIKTHLDDTDSQICDELDLVGKLSDFD